MISIATFDKRFSDPESLFFILRDEVEFFDIIGIQNSFRTFHHADIVGIAQCSKYSIDIIFDISKLPIIFSERLLSGLDAAIALLYITVSDDIGSNGRQRTAVVHKMYTCILIVAITCKAKLIAMSRNIYIPSKS